MSSLQIEMAVAAICLLFLITYFLKRNSMSVKNYVAWLLLPIVFIIIALFPDPIASLSKLLGFETFSNFLFLIINGLLLILCFFLTISLSKQQAKITKLIQEVSILKQKVNTKAKNKKQTKAPDKH